MTATCTTPALGAGPHTIVAVYSGGTSTVAGWSFAPSTSPALAQSVGNPTGTTVTSSGSPAPAGQAVTLTASVSLPSGMGNPTGTVAFTAEGTTIAGCATRPLEDPGVRPVTATCTTSALKPGRHSIVASYSGGASNVGGWFFDPSVSPALAQTVASLTMAICSPPLIRAGQTTTCTATVTGQSAHPTGPVTFSSDSAGTFAAPTCTLQLTGGNQARCAVTYTPTSAQNIRPQITARYAGDPQNLASQGLASVDVLRAPSATSVSCAPSVVVFGQPTTCTATVTGPAGLATPVGQVTFGRNQLDGAFSATACTLVARGRRISRLLGVAGCAACVLAAASAIGYSARASLATGGSA